VEELNEPKSYFLEEKAVFLKSKIGSLLHPHHSEPIRVT
jgi:hypothetical protein|tara:strand:- start:8417 stop:8533 length:117 start_codon:yes stop_codon:yes gene_type:complete